MSLRKAHHMHVLSTAERLKAELDCERGNLALLFSRRTDANITEAQSHLREAYWNGLQSGDLFEAKRHLTLAFVRIEAALKDVSQRAML